MSFKKQVISGSSKNHLQSHEQESKKIILIELTSILIFVAFVLFRVILYIWPEEFLPSIKQLQELLYFLAGWLTTSSLVHGAMISFVSWHLVYFNSAAPGINPPTPLSPQKYRVMSGADFHLSYLFAITIGPLVTTLMHFDYA